MKIGKALYRENGLRWTIHYLAYWVLRFFFRIDSSALYRSLIKLERKNNLPGFNAASVSSDIWDLLSWEKEGEEWTASAEWKDALIRDVMMKYIEPGKVVLEIGPGAGRWTEVLRKTALKLIAVDVSPKSVDLCRKKFATAGNASFHLIGSSSLDFIADGSIDRIWSFDVFVHINPLETENYFAEFKRVLAEGGCAVIHHPKDGGMHGGCRSRMTDSIFISLLEKRGLQLIRQFDSWGDKNQFNLSRHNDCITVFKKA